MKETMIETDVTYTLEYDGKFHLIEHVPVCVCREKGELYLYTETVEKMQPILKGKKEPTKLIETPVYEYA